MPEMSEEVQNSSIPEATRTLPRSIEAQISLRVRSLRQEILLESLIEASHADPHRSCKF